MKRREWRILGIVFFALLVCAVIFLSNRNINGNAISAEELKILKLNPSNYRLFDPLQKGDKYYIDRNYKINSIPNFLNECDVIKTSNSNPKQISFESDKKIKIYLAWDMRQEIPSEWTKENEKIYVTDKDASNKKGYLQLISKEFSEGKISIPKKTEKSNYLVFVCEKEKDKKVITPKKIFDSNVPISPVNGSAKYVTAEGSGLKNGNDWDNSYSGLPSKLTRGSVYYLASGNYGDYIFDDALSGKNYIYLRKATVENSGNVRGWKQDYEGQAVFDSWKISTSYWFFDGVSKIDESSGHGFKITNEQTPMNIEPNADHLIFSNIEFSRPSATSGFDIVSMTGGSNDDIRFSNCYFKNSGMTFIHFDGAISNGLLIEKCNFDGLYTDYGWHGEGLQLRGNKNVTIRWSKFSNLAGDVTAVIASMSDGGKNWYIYGNIFDCKEEKFLSQANSGSLSDVYIYNNDLKGSEASITSVSHSNVNFVNNIIYGSSWTPLEVDNHSYNYYSNSCFQYSFVPGVGEPKVSDSGDSVCSVVKGDPFVNSAIGNYRLKMPLKGYSGVSLDAPYNLDYYGNIRGADGVFDRGAIEYS